ncbi:hypothetical protein niasHT_014186 [Heterodera trifolii]|uniref:Uncharacterized protein n=1 Tax=Heterodera trifolii TaxID=157864 RepID=A0ABD2KYX6_9BILA
MTSPSTFSAARLFAKLSGNSNQQQQSIEHKMAELRAAYATQPAQTTTTVAKSGANSTQNKSSAAPPPRRPGRTSLPTPSLGDMLELPQLSSRSCVPSRRASTVTACFSPAPSLMDLASSAGLLSLSPSDLVFESSVLGIAYYDFVLSVSEVSSYNDDLVPATVRPASSAATAARNKTAAASSAAHATATSLEPPPSQHTSAVGSRARVLSPATKRRVHGTGSDPTTQLTPSTAAAAGGRGGIAAAPQLNQQRKSGMFAKLAESGKKQRAQQQQQAATDATTGERKASLVENIAQLAEICEAVTDTCLDSSDHSLAVYRLLLAKLDQKTNVEWFESVLVPAALLERNGIPVSELSLLTMGILVWRCTLNNARLLCLVNSMPQQQTHEDGNATAASFEALKRAASKYKCMHHVLTIGQRRPSAGSTHSSCSSSSRRSSTSSGSFMQHHQQDPGMKLRVLMCQSRNELPEFPSHALRDAKFLLASSTNPLFCLCFPLT